MFREKFSGKTDESSKESVTFKENVTEVTAATLKRLELNRKSVMKALVTYPGITKDSILQAFRRDPRIISAEYKNGRFYLKTAEGNSSFKLVFPEKKV